MSSFEFNKILAAIILAIIVIVIISKVGDIIVDNNKTDLQETANKIDNTSKYVIHNKKSYNNIKYKSIHRSV